MRAQLVSYTFLSLCSGLYLIAHSTHAQELNQFYEGRESDKSQYALITDANQEKFKKIIKAGKNIGHLWQCGKNTYLFYDGWVFVGSKKDGSDLGDKPYNLVSNYFVKNDLIRFSFKGLPFENRFELNTTTLTIHSTQPMFHTSSTLECSMIH